MRAVFVFSVVLGGCLRGGPTEDDPTLSTGTPRAPVLQVEPLQARVPPGAQITPVDLGSQEITCRLVTNASGAELAGCTWTAGPTDGVDEVEVTSVGSEPVVARYSVSSDAVFGVVGERIFLPLGHAFVPEFTAGTQLVDAEVAGSGLRIDEAGWLGEAEGAYVVSIRDRYVASLSTQVLVDVAAPRAHTPRRDGEDTLWGDVIGADVDGDGYADAVVASPEVALGAHYSGAVHIYPGGRDGLGPPIHSYTTDQQGAWLGRDIALGDVDDDGNLDLAIGISSWDEGDRDRGQVEIYRGVSGGFFELEPWFQATGELAFDQLGSSVELCDVDGDGHDDLVVGAVGVEDRTVDPIAFGEGAVFVFEGSDSGMSTAPRWVVYSGQGGGQMGRALASGDVDADDRCDVTVSSVAVALDGDGTDGAVWLVRGATFVAGGRGVVEPDRVYVPSGPDPNVQMGRALAMGDVDGDDLDDVVAGAWRWDDSGVSNGAVFVFVEADHVDVPFGGSVSSEAAFATIRGNEPYDYLGVGVSVADGAVWVGAGGGEATQFSADDVGAVGRFEGQELQRDMVLADASQLWWNQESGSFFGTVVGVVGDTNGSGTSEIVTLAGRDDRWGANAGAAYVLHASGDVEPLEWPGEAAGSHFGDTGSVAFVAPVAKGSPDLVVGAWGAAGEARHNVGAAFRFSASEGLAGVDTVYTDRPTQGSSDRFGHGVSAAGDFDGDGVEDLVVVAFDGDRPGVFGVPFTNPAECPGSTSNSGSALVFSGSSIEPSFAFYGAQVADRFEVVAGGFDHDGDGYDDVVVGSTLAGEGGGITLVRGRPKGDGIEVICEPSRWYGVGAARRFGSSVAGLGDLDRDGCDELGVGTEVDDLGFVNAGSLRVLWGYGAACRSTMPQVTTLVAAGEEQRMGTALAGGHDVDDDGVPDLIVGGETAQRDGEVVGAFWLLSGKWVASRSRQPASTFPAHTQTEWHIVPADSVVHGSQPSGGLGTSLAFLPDWENPGRALLAVGQPAADVGGVQRAGAVWLWRWTDIVEPVGLVVGETTTPGSRFGAALATHPSSSLLAVGAPLSDAAGLDSGAVYPFEILRSDP
ncbi:MAG: VCBS repeat-containing protein [Myxococcales bacterium]|nr:VCBS repeat-containing protein [Myxococcales bacterium]